MKKVFLSASVPDPSRDPRYYQTANVVAIREAIRALVTVILPNATLVWGGHPAITPMIRIIAEGMNIPLQERVILYQSEFFSDKFPESNSAFERIELIGRRGSKEESLAVMRRRMLTEHHFSAGVFIGGMDGVEEEYRLFKRYQPFVPILPIASTGGAAEIIFETSQEQLSPDLKNNYSYLSLFRRNILLI